MTDSNEIARFYDAFTSRQLRAAFNERHFLLVDRLKARGLSRRSNVLELGCGVGIITSLVTAIVTEGRVVAVDLSPASVELARKRLAGRGQVDFVAASIAELSCPGIQFDFVTLFDVLEHIPVELHGQVFRRIADHMNAATQLLINIPTPEHLEYLKLHDPGELQIVDQPLQADGLLQHAYSAGLTVDLLETYDIWHHRDYQMFVLRRKAPFGKVPVRVRPGLLTKMRRLLLARGVSL